jgi:hypothetical protein
MEQKTTPIKASVLKVLYKGLKPIIYRLDCLLEDHYKENIFLSQAELTVAFEFRSAASTVELLMVDYFEQVDEHNVEMLYLPNKEFQLLLDLSKTAELAYRAPLANSGLWTH